MAILEGAVSGAVAGVGAESASPLHISSYPISPGSGGWFRLGAVSGTMAASLGANSEIFQFRYVTAAGRIALIQRVAIAAGLNVAATAAALAAFRMTAARTWTAAGTGGTRLSVASNNAKLRTSYATSEVSDAGISTTAALGAGTKTLDTIDMGAAAFGIGTGAITTSVALQLMPYVFLFDAGASSDHPLVLAHQEGFVIRTGSAFPAGATWHFGVSVLWAEVPAF